MHPHDVLRLLGVYPRVCGGTRSRNPSPTWGRGLSPRVRGNLVHRDTDEGNRGSIPACAGEPEGYGVK